MELGKLRTYLLITFSLLGLFSILTINVLKLEVVSTEVRFAKPWHYQFTKSGPKTKIA